MADAAYDGDHLCHAIAVKGALAVIPNKPVAGRSNIRSTSISTALSALSLSLLICCAEWMHHGDRHSGRITTLTGKPAGCSCHHSLFFRVQILIKQLTARRLSKW
jgi:hypothetical protein